MAKYTLYHYPLRACSSVTFNALEEAGLDYDDQAIDIINGEQKSPDYLKINPGGKVPALKVDDKVLTENAAILMFLDKVAPSAKLLPPTDDPFEKAISYSDLVWCSATFHTAIRQVRMPIRFTDVDPEGVQKRGIEYVTAIFNQVEQRLSQGDWWYGDQWSIVDVYLNWCIMTGASTELFPMNDYPAIQSHIQNVHARPSFQSAIARQMASMEKAGIVFPDE